MRLSCWKEKVEDSLSTNFTNFTNKNFMNRYNGRWTVNGADSLSTNFTNYTNKNFTSMSRSGAVLKVDFTTKNTKGFHKVHKGNRVAQP
jgi:hypothetical protein